MTMVCRDPGSASWKICCVSSHKPFLFILWMNSGILFYHDSATHDTAKIIVILVKEAIMYKPQCNLFTFNLRINQQRKKNIVMRYSKAILFQTIVTNSRKTLRLTGCLSAEMQRFQISVRLRQQRNINTIMNNI